MNIENILKEYNKSITKERIDIFSFISEKHLFSANDLILKFGNLGRASIFRTINLFLEIGIIRKISFGERSENYEIVNDDENHHEHMKCEKCSKIINFNSDNICKKILSEASNIGFKVKDHSISIIGTCKNCL
ncbi:MAG: transcriptional repressor [Candidatus Gracilibacteria bacterium]|nr:transcriptional repressor [Candidatus Gracilibacteria bacterium]